MKNWVDLVFIVVALFGFIQGYKAGFLSTIFSVLGYIGGGINDDGVRKGTHASKTIHTTPEAEGADD